MLPYLQERTNRGEDTALRSRGCVFPFKFNFLKYRFIEAAITHSLTLHCSPLPAKDILQLGEVLDERHHLSLEALGVDILHRGHLQ